ncbi:MULTISPECIES: penicillin acylase family protein [unclassified Streptomyces]|uniref:penicillin acylase family protein n=1 Tax=unclassified Streptomyces TaxID=2593676 RepID=UPI0036E7FFB3
MTTDWGTVALHRAVSGMPLLDADSEPAAFFGLGYAQAADDLHGVLRQYLLVRGELATLGDTDDAVERDRNQRLWRIREEAEDAYRALEPSVQECCRAFIAGVRARMAEHPDVVPDWAPPLDPWLPIGVNRTVMLYWTIADAVAVLRAAGVPLPPVVSELDRTPMVPGSNAWVLMPARTRDGETILVSDPHLPFGGSLALYEATVATPTLHYTGFVFLGAMLPALAHNADVAWAVTTGGPRVSDAYRVPDTDADAVVLNGVRSPVVARHDGAAYVICSPYTGKAGDTELQLLRMLRSRSAAELRQVLSACAFAPQNVLAADRHGHAFYVRTGRVPRRAADAVGVLEPTQLWDGFLGQDELVHVADPESGWLENANSAPDTVTPGIRAADWAPDAFHDVPGRQTSRSIRGIQLLSSPHAVGVDEVMAWAQDDLWPDTPKWQAGLAAAADAEPERVAKLPAERRELLATLLRFDGRAASDSTDASAWLSWRKHIAATPVAPGLLRELVDAFDAGLLLAALEHCPLEVRAYGEIHRFASGAPGRAGAFTVRPVAPGDVQPAMQVPLRATYFSHGVAVGGGPALRIVRFGAGGMSSWSLALPAHAEMFARGEVFATAFHPADAELRQRLAARHEKGD